MRDLHERIANLSPEQRKLFDRLLDAEGLVIPPELNAPSRESHASISSPSSDQRRSADSVEPRLTIPRRKAGARIPLSFAQQRLWFLEQLMPGNPFYNRTVALRLGSRIQVDVLEASLRTLLRRHDSLRTAIRHEGGEPFQVIVDDPPFSLERKNLIDLPDAERDLEARRMVADQGNGPFDFTQAPLLRALLIDLNLADCGFVLTMHHIICDGWSLGVLFRELTALYEAGIRGHVARLPDLHIQYADYAVWQREWLQGESLERLLSYWRGQLQNLPVLQLPTDRPRPRVQDFRGDVLEIDYTNDLLTALYDLSLRERVTLFMTLLTAFLALLHRYTGEEDVVVGTYVANRDRPELEGLVGFFVNSLVLRADLSARPTFREALRRVREMTLEAYAHQALPFERLVEELHPERDLSRNPLFQIVFQLEQLAGESAPKGGQRLATAGSALFDLAFNLTEFPQSLHARIEYSTDLFEAGTIQRMAKHFELILRAIATNADLPLRDISILSEEERCRFLVERNNTRRDLPTDGCVHHLVESQVGRTPEAPAVMFEGAMLTYAQLNRQANRLARYLLQLGVAPEECVGMCMPPSLELVVGLLGILKAGGSYVPLDPSYPKARLQLMLEDSSARIVLTHRTVTDVLPDGIGLAVCLDLPDPWAGEDDTDLDLPVGTRQLAYTSYTSGSTGRPKGVQVDHRAVLNFLLSMREEPGFHSNDVFASLASVCFDISVLEIFLPLTLGARVLLASREISADGIRLAQFLQQAQVTVLQATPATWRLLLDAYWDGDTRLTLLSGGEAIPAEISNWLLARCGALWNMYGPTETTVWSAVQRVAVFKNVVPIGHPIANTRIYLLDSSLLPVPIGVPGEIFIAGTGLARGYRRRPDLTAAAFIPDPYADEAGARMYCTGDLGRYRSDGTIEFLGRLDHQVKVRGHRIELSDVENALARHANVRECVVIPRPEGLGDRRLVAFVVPRELPGPSIAELRRTAADALPAFMIPSSFTVLAEIPRTPNRKIDREALGKLNPSRRSRDQEFVAPQTKPEERMVQLWCDILELDQVGIHDNFFDLGGHSLLATRLISRIRDEFHTETPLRSVFEYPTLAELTACVLRLLQDTTVVPKAIPRLEREPYQRAAPAHRFAP